MNSMVNYIDQLVSKRIKICRLKLGSTQADLGRELNVSIQQIQKYENGINRISSGKLYVIASFFKVPVNHFFDQNNSDYFYNKDININEKEAIILLKNFYEIQSSEFKNIILKLVKAVNAKNVIDDNRI